MNEPTQFGRYQVVRVLGRGAMGLVYEGFDPRLRRQVAIKVISTAALADSELRASYSQRFVLGHDLRVKLTDFGVARMAAVNAGVFAVQQKILYDQPVPPSCRCFAWGTAASTVIARKRRC